MVKEKGIQLIHNGGVLNLQALAEATHSLLQSYTVDLAIAYVEGDDVTGLVDRLRETLGRLDTSTPEVVICRPFRARSRSRMQMLT